MIAAVIHWKTQCSSDGQSGGAEENSFGGLRRRRWKEPNLDDVQDSGGGKKKHPGCRVSSDIWQEKGAKLNTSRRVGAERSPRLAAHVSNWQFKRKTTDPERVFPPCCSSPRQLVAEPTLAPVAIAPRTDLKIYFLSLISGGDWTWSHPSETFCR